MPELSKVALQVDSNQSFPNNNNGYITPAILRSYNTNVIDSTVNQIQYTADSGSWNSKIAIINAKTGSFATTGSNNFIGNQVVTGNVTASFFSGDGSGLTNVFSTPSPAINEFTQSQDEKNLTLAAYTSSMNSFTSSINSYTSSNDTKWNTLGGISGSWITESETGSFARTNVSNTFTATQTINADLIVSGTINAYRINTTIESSSVIFSSGSNVLGDELTDTQTLSGSVKVQGTLTLNGTAVLTSSADITPLNQFTQSQESKNSTLGVYTASLDSKFSTLGTYTASVDTKFTTIGGLTGSYATTGSNFFAGVQSINYTQTVSSGEVYLLSDSGSLVIGNSASTPTYAGLAHLSSSQVNSNTNIIFKTNNNTADTIISGANNIFLNPASPTAGFKRYLGGNGNIVLQTELPQVTGSMGFSPTMNNNIWDGSGVVSMRGPASSSTWTISNNIVNNSSNWTIGTGAGTPANQMVSGFTANGNVGSLNPAITAWKTPLSSSAGFTQNIGNSTVTMNCDSSSISFATNIVGGSTTINNSYLPGTITAQSGLIGVSNNNLFGTTIVNASGSNTTFTGAPRGAYNNIIGGYSTIGLVLNVDSSSLNSSAIIGGGLVVTGSNSRAAGATANNDWGSAFFGRWNDVNGNRDQSAETVFAVGTGTTNTTRKTGFLIDSGSNTFVEGTLNVSGGVFQNVIPVTIASSTASLDFSKGTYFTLTLADNTTTHIAPTTLLAGVSATLVITTGTNSSASLAPTMLQPSGFSYSATSGTGKIDLLSLVSTNTSNVFVVSTKNMI